MRISEINQIANGEIKLVVDYTKTLEETCACGGYDLVNSGIKAEDFPIPPEMVGKKIEVSARLFNFNCVVGSKNAIFAMNAAGYPPANIMELLALGILFPELQLYFPIIALGSIVKDSNGDCYVPCLIVNGHRIRLFKFDGSWGHICRFLGVRINNKIV